MKKLFLLCATMFFFLLSVPTYPQCISTSVPYPNMGINLPDVMDMPWINLYNQINPWHSMYNGGLPLGADGWPNGASNRFVIGEDIGTVVPIQGVVKISYKGTVSQFGTPSGGTIITANSK